MKLYFGATLSGHAYRSAVAILPLALVAFCLSMVTAIYQSALYGCHLIVQRNGILIFESLSFLLLSVVLAPRYGLFGLVYARAAQNLVTLTVSVLVLKRYLPPVTMFPHRWKKDLFMELAGYALSFQFVSLLSMAMDPLTKGLLSRFGSLEMVTYFEMGTRLIGQVRGIVVNANQVLVPTFAQVSQADAPQVDVLFRKSYAVIFFVTVCSFGLLAASLPLLDILWLGAEHPVFVKTAMILCLGWLINTLAVPAYFACLGTGAMRGVVQSHLLMALLNVSLGYSFGRWWGAYGVVAAWAIALGAGGLLMHLTYCVRSSLGWRSLLPAGGLGLIAFCVVGVLFGRFAQAWIGTISPSHLPIYAVSGKFSRVEIVSSASALLCFVMVFLLPAVRNPVRGELVRWIGRRRA
jgi:O-antigen/teichoic acid export membrane protein